jgi:hypothetical protein
VLLYVPTDNSRSAHFFLTFSNYQDAKAFTLHLYSPPYTRTHYYEPTSGERRAIEIPLFDSDAIGLDPFKR